MRERFPSLDADDVIEETLIAVCAALPSCRYVPDEKGYFHNYLTGILRNKALRQLSKDNRQAEIAEEMRRSRGMKADDEQSWRKALLEIALRQLLNDESIQSRTRQVFLRIAVNGDSPNDVAAAFGIERNAIDQIQSRMMPRRQKIVSALEKAGNV